MFCFQGKKNKKKVKAPVKETKSVSTSERKEPEEGNKLSVSRHLISSLSHHQSSSRLGLFNSTFFLTSEFGDKLNEKRTNKLQKYLQAN